MDEKSKKVREKWSPNAKANRIQSLLFCQRSARSSFLHLHLSPVYPSRLSFLNSRPSFHSYSPISCIYSHPTTKPTMSDDEDYYEWDDEYLLEDLVPDLVVSNPYCSCRKNIVPGKD